MQWNVWTSMSLPWQDQWPYISLKCKNSNMIPIAWRELVCILYWMYSSLKNQTTCNIALHMPVIPVKAVCELSSTSSTLKFFKKPVKSAGAHIVIQYGQLKPDFAHTALNQKYCMHMPGVHWAVSGSQTSVREFCWPRTYICEMIYVLTYSNVGVNHVIGHKSWVHDVRVMQYWPQIYITTNIYVFQSPCVCCPMSVTSVLRDKQVALIGAQTGCPYWGTNRLPLLRDKQVVLIVNINDSCFVIKIPTWYNEIQSLYSNTSVAVRVIEFAFSIVYVCCPAIIMHSQYLHNMARTSNNLHVLKLSRYNCNCPFARQT